MSKSAVRAFSCDKIDGQTTWFNIDLDDGRILHVTVDDEGLRMDVRDINVPAEYVPLGSINLTWPEWADEAIRTQYRKDPPAAYTGGEV